MNRRAARAGARPLGAAQGGRQAGGHQGTAEIVTAGQDFHLGEQFTITGSYGPEIDPAVARQSLTHEFECRRFLGRVDLDASQAHAIDPVVVPHLELRGALYGKHFSGEGGGWADQQQGSDQSGEDGAQQVQSLAPQLGQNRWALAVLLPQLPH